MSNYKTQTSRKQAAQEEALWKEYRKDDGKLDFKEWLDKIDFDKLSPRLRGLIAYVFENTFNPEMPDGKATIGAIGVGIEDLYYILNAAARAEIYENTSDVKNQ